MGIYGDCAARGPAVSRDSTDNINTYVRKYTYADNYKSKCTHTPRYVYPFRSFPYLFLQHFQGRFDDCQRFSKVFDFLHLSLQQLDLLFVLVNLRASRPAAERNRKMYAYMHTCADV